MEQTRDQRIPNLIKSIITSLDRFRFDDMFHMFDSKEKVDIARSQFSSQVKRIKNLLTNYPSEAFSINILTKVTVEVEKIITTSFKDVANTLQILEAMGDELQQHGKSYIGNYSVPISKSPDSINKTSSKNSSEVLSRAISIEETLENILVKAKSTSATLREEERKSRKLRDDFEAELVKIKVMLEEAKFREERLNEYEQSLITTKNAFNAYETNIKEAISSTNEIIDKTDEINSLLKAAEEAVGLKATEGVSAAFIKERNEAKKGLQYWLNLTYIFIIGAIFSTLWILGGWYISDPHSWQSIIGRVAVVTIMIAGATFSSKQYVRQKSISDDYSYKAVLSQSIIAFTDQIRSRSDAQVVEYLSQVLNEIHKDPQRPRKSHTNAEIKIELMEMMNKVVDKVIAAK